MVRRTTTQLAMAMRDCVDNGAPAADYLGNERPLMISITSVGDTATGPFNDTPYWIFQVPKEIIDDHGQILQSNFVGLLTGLIHMGWHDLEKKRMLSIEDMSSEL